MSFAASIFHWVQVITISLKILTGLSLNNPGFLNLSMSWVREIHYYLTYLLLINFILWGYYYLVTGSNHTLIIKVRHIEQVPVFLNYEILSNHQHPYYGTYNPRQKPIYSIWLMLIMVELLSGLSLYFQDIFQGLLTLAGGVPVVRLYHFWGAIGFLVTVPLHIYLALAEAPAKLERI